MPKLQAEQVEGLVAKQSGGKVAISIPGFQCSNLVISVKNVEYKNANNYYWYGEITSENDDPCLEGTLTLMANNGEKFGHVIVDSTVYEFSRIGEGYR